MATNVKIDFKHPSCQKIIRQKLRRYESSCSVASIANNAAYEADDEAETKSMPTLTELVNSCRKLISSISKDKDTHFSSEAKANFKKLRNKMQRLEIFQRQLNNGKSMADTKLHDIERCTNEYQQLLHNLMDRISDANDMGRQIQQAIYQQYDEIHKGIIKLENLKHSFLEMGSVTTSADETDSSQSSTNPITVPKCAASPPALTPHPPQTVIPETSLPYRRTIVIRYRKKGSKRMTGHEIQRAIISTHVSFPVSIIVNTILYKKHLEIECTTEHNK